MKEKTTAIREARERAERLRELREQWRRERLHEMAVAFELAFAAQIGGGE